MKDLIFTLLWAIIWVAITYALLKHNESKKLLEWKNSAEKMMKDAESQKNSIIKDAKKEANDLVDEARKNANELAKKAEKLEERLLEKEEKFEKKLDDLTNKQEKLLEKEENIKKRQDEVDEVKAELDNKLSEISKLSTDEAKEQLFKQIQDKYQEDLFKLVEKHKKSVEERKSEVSREILIKSIQQYAWDVTSEVTTTLIPLPNDDIKWKLIWKEWRNITAFERATGVALIIDDTPDTVFISSFDLFKRYVAKKSLEKLIEDGRIQPARIEEIVEYTTNEAGVLLKEIWTKTVDDLNLTGIPEEILPIIWKLRFRTSYGQNILKHSIETAYIAESIAQSLNLDAELIKKWALLHDIWKALDHDIEWTHPEIWANLCRKYSMNEHIIDMIEHHHNDSNTISIYASIVQVADAISSVRPWARRESIEQYIKRVKELEALASSFSWVKKAYAISAWREIRVFVDADIIWDFEAQEMARNIAIEMENKMNYPWEVKVSLFRELRVIEYAK